MMMMMMMMLMLLLLMMMMMMMMVMLLLLMMMTTTTIPQSITILFGLAGVGPDLGRVAWDLRAQRLLDWSPQDWMISLCPTKRC